MSNNQKLIFDFIVTYKRKHDGNSPTVRQIQKGCRISSMSVVTYHLQKLEKACLIKRTADARGIEVVGGAWELRHS